MMKHPFLITQTRYISLSLLFPSLKWHTTSTLQKPWSWPRSPISHLPPFLIWATPSPPSSTATSAASPPSSPPQPSSPSLSAASNPYPSTTNPSSSPATFSPISPSSITSFRATPPQRRRIIPPPRAWSSVTSIQSSSYSSSANSTSTTARSSTRRLHGGASSYAVTSRIQFWDCPASVGAPMEKFWPNSSIRWGDAGIWLI